MQAGTTETESTFSELGKRTVTVLVFVWNWYEGRREAVNWGFRALAA